MESFLPQVDSGQLKTQLNKIMSDVNAVAADSASISGKGTEYARQCITEFSNFFVSCAERRGTTPHAVLGQHVTTNVFIFVLERIVKPNLMAYCRAAEKHASSALEATTLTPTTTSNTGRRDVLEARRRRLRGDIIRPFLQLFQSLHASLMAEGEPLSSQEQPPPPASYLVGDGDEARVVCEGTGNTDTTRHEKRRYLISEEEALDATAQADTTASTSGDVDSFDNNGVDISSSAAFLHSLSQAPLLWKNASPLNIFCNHILEVLESQWLVAVVGADYAALLLEVLRWSGYARLITPIYLVRLSNCLIGLLERVPIQNSSITEDNNNGDNSTVNAAFPPNLALQEVADGRVWMATPNADDACVYAQVLGRLYGLSQVASAYPPSTAPARATGTAYTNSSRAHCSGDARNALATVHRLINLVKERHQSPTPDLRLEAYCVAALRQLCGRFQHDHPSAAQAPTSIVKLLCDFFFLPPHTPRHDVWRLEVMQFVAAMLSYALSDLVEERLWKDLHIAASQKPNTRISRAKEGDDMQTISLHKAVDAAQPSQMHRELLGMLHQTVYPTMYRVFTQPRHEYSFTSRRELFSFPCSPLQEVFDFGAIVLYLSSATHEAYSDMRTARGRTNPIISDQRSNEEGRNTSCGTAVQQRQEHRKRRREADSDFYDEEGGDEEYMSVGCSSKPAQSATPRQPHPVQLLCDALIAEFFQPTPSAPTTAVSRSRSSLYTSLSAATPGGASSIFSTCRPCSGASPLLLKLRTIGLRTSSAAIHDIVSDRALFLLHLFAQPISTIHCPQDVADALLEDVLLPLSAAFRLRLGPLLLATIRAVVVHGSSSTQFGVFAALAQRYFPPHLSSTGPTSTIVATTSSVREDLMNPSEPVYRVLVALLERQLNFYQRYRHLSRFSLSSEHVRSLVPDIKAESAAAWRPLDDVRVIWETHLHAAVARVESQLHTFQQAVQRIREAVTLAREASASGSTRTEFAAGASGEESTTATTEVVAAATATTPVSVLASTAASPSLTYTPVLSSAFALLLTRFAVLVQCARLVQLTVPSGTSTEYVDQMDNNSCGLDFVLSAAAHGVDFYERVPLLRHPEGMASTTTHNNDNSGGGGGISKERTKHNNNTTAAGLDAFSGGKSGVRSTKDERLSFAALSIPSGNFSGAAFLALFSPADFMAWLAVAENYACAVLWMCRAQKQMIQRSQLQSHRVQVPGEGSMTQSRGGGGAPAVVASTACFLSDPLRREVGHYLDALCEEVNEAAANPSGKVPSVLRDATESHWMLRTPSPSHRYMAPKQKLLFSAQGDDRHPTQAGPASKGVARPSLPRSFQISLATSVQRAVMGQMQRAQLLDCMNADITASAADISRKELSGEVALGDHAAPFVERRSSAALLLSVQCVQLLHLLLRWRRAGLWFPPEEHIDGTASEAASDSIKSKRKCNPERSEKTNSTEAEAHTSPSSNVKDSRAADIDTASCNKEYTKEQRENVQYEEQQNMFDVSNTATVVDAAGRADLRIFLSSPRLFDSPLSMLERFSIRGGGRLYYTVLWLCQYVQLQLHQLLANADILSTLPLCAALRGLYNDVGTVLLDPSVACVDPRQTILQFTAAVTKFCFHCGVAPLSQWRPSNPNSREFSRIVTCAFHLLLETLHFTATAVRDTGIEAYAAVPLMDVVAIRHVLLRLLERQALADANPSWTAVELDDVLLPSQHSLIAQKHPFLPTVLPVLPALLRLLFVFSTTENERAKESSSVLTDGRTIVQLLQILFARYRYQIGPALCSGLMGGVLADVARLLRFRTYTVSSRSVPMNQNSADMVESMISLLYTQCGRLLELWTAQLTDPSRIDMPVCTPQWQCALLQAAFAAIVRCEPAVAEVLGRFSFEFLSGTTPFFVRRHAALHVGILFHTFSVRRAQVLRTLLVKVREGVLSPTPMLCSTSLLSLSEAVRVAPELRVDVLYTLLECWATRGFTQRPLIVECMLRLTRCVVEDATQTPSTASALDAATRTLPYSDLCRMHARHCLFLWLCKYKHPLAALPFACFGYAALEDFIVDQLVVLVPLALLLLTESNGEAPVVLSEIQPRPAQRDAGTTSGHNASPSTSTTAPVGAAPSTTGNLFHQLLQVYTERVLCASSAVEGDATKARGCRSTKKREKSGATTTAGNQDAEEGAADEIRQLAPLCMVVQYFPHIAVQLLVIASNAPVPLFSVEAAELDVGAPIARSHVEGARYTGHTQQQHEGGGGGRYSGGVHPNDESSVDTKWCDAAQKCLYWLEALFNTCEDVALVQATAYVSLRKVVAVNDCVMPDVSAVAGAAVLDPAVSMNSAEVLVFYLKRVAVWPHARPVFDVFLAAHVDAALQEVAQLHRTTAEPAQIVYGTPEQLQRVLTWIAKKVTAVPLKRDTFGVSTPASSVLSTGTAMPWRHPMENDGRVTEDEKSIVDDTQRPPTSSNTTIPMSASSDLNTWQAWSLHLLVPPLLITDDAAYKSMGASRGRRSFSEDFFSHDPLSCFFLLGNGAFLHSLLQAVYRSCTAPASLECCLRGPQQLSLLTSICTRWCSSRVLAAAQPLQTVLTFLLHLLRQDGTVETRRVVCDALLHVWPVALSSHSSHSYSSEYSKQTKADDESTITMKVMKSDVHAADTHLWTCAVLLSRVMEPLVATSSVVASTWKALCRVDATLLRCEWHRQAEAFRRHHLDEGHGTETSHRDASNDIIDVDGTSDDDDGAKHANEDEANEKSEVDAAAPHANAALSPPHMRSWSWATYLKYRNACLAPLQRISARQDLRTLVALLHHICGREDYINCMDDSSTDSNDTVGSYSVELEDKGCWDLLNNSTAAAPPSSALLRNVAVGVDSTRARIARCLEVASILNRGGARVIQQAGHNLSSSSGITSTTKTTFSIRPAEKMSIAVQHAVLCAVARLYRWSLARPMDKLDPGAFDVDFTAAPTAATTAATTLEDSEDGEDQALACFELLRSLSLCVVQAGEGEGLTSVIKFPGYTGNGFYAVTSVSSNDANNTTASYFGFGKSDGEDDLRASAEQLAAASLGHAYVQQLCQLAQLASTADAYLAEMAVRTLRAWTLPLQLSAQNNTAGALSSFDAGVLEVMCRAYAENRSSEKGYSNLNTDVCVTYAPLLLRQLLWTVRSVHNPAQSHNARPLVECSSRFLPPPLSFSAAHVTDASVWRPLRKSLLMERAFLCRFVAAMANTYGVWKRSILWTSLQPILYAELQQQMGDATDEPENVDDDSRLTPIYASRGRQTSMSMSAQLLTPLVIHILCLRESDGQRAARREWSELLDRHVIQQAHRCPYTAKLFLRTLYACHVILVRLTRQRGLKGSTAASKLNKNDLNNNNRAPAVLANTEDSNATAPGNRFFSWPTAFGAVPILQDMQECCWLSDIPASHLARAAVIVQEPHLALFFAQLSGESLFGPRTGCAALCGEMQTTRSAILLKDGTVGGPTATAVSSVPYSVLFPYAKYEDYPSSSSGSTTAGGKAALDAAAAGRSGGRARERQGGIRQQTRHFTQHIFAIYEAAQRQMDVDDVSGVSALMRRVAFHPDASSNGPEEEGREEDGVGRVRSTPWEDVYMGSASLAHDTMSGTVIRRRAQPSVNNEGDAEDHRDGWTNALRELEEEAALSGGFEDNRTGSGTNKKGGGGAFVPNHSDPWWASLKRAAWLLERGLPSTSMDVLLSLNTRREEAQINSINQAPNAFPHKRTDTHLVKPLLDLEDPSSIAGPALNEASLTSALHTSAPWTAHHESCLRSLLFAAAWRCARWTHTPSITQASVLENTQTDNIDGTAAVTAAFGRSFVNVFQATAIPPAVLERLAEAPTSSSALSASSSLPLPGGFMRGGGFYEHLLKAFLALSGGAPQLCLPHLRNAEASLRVQLSAATALTTVMAAEALNEVRWCAYAVWKRNSTKTNSDLANLFDTVALPRWLEAEKKKIGNENDNSNVADQHIAASVVDQLGRTSWRLLDSVRHALSQIYGSKDGWYHFLMGATERALAFHEPALAHRWLTDWERREEDTTRLREGGGSNNGLSSQAFVAEQRRIDVALRKAQVAYALGRWQEALALLQPPAASSVPSLRTTATETSFESAFNTPLEPRVVQQLMLWHAELQLVPSSQLVRDPFLSRAAASDTTGVCSFLLARLCHTLASDIAGRLMSHEHQQLKEGVEESKRQRRELEAQLHAATAATATNTAAASSTISTTRAGIPPKSGQGREVVVPLSPAVKQDVAVRSDEQLRLLRRRIRELTGDVKRFEDEWETETSNYSLYRRSALNAYSRYLQFHRLGSSSPLSTQQQKNARGNNNGSGGGTSTLEKPSVTCLRQDDAENTLHAIFGFVELWLNAEEIEQGGGVEVLGKVLDKAVERIPTAVFLPLASQLTAQLGGPKDAVRLSFLVSRIAQDYPLHVLWSLLALCHGHTFAKSREVNTLHAVDEAKIKAAQDLLANIGPPTKSTKTAANAGGGTPLSATSIAIKVKHAQLLSSAYLELAFDRGANAVQTEKRYAIKSDFLLLKEARHLSIPPPTLLPLSSSANPYDSDVDASSVPFLTPHVLRYRPYFTTPGGVNVPKVLLCELSDGQVVRQLLKAGDDLRQDALIEQVFQTANELFYRREATRPLRIRTFIIVPLAPTAGILQWVENTIPLGEYVTGRYTGKEESPGAHERYFPGEPTTRECRLQLQDAPPRSRTEVLLKLYQAFTPALHYFFFEYFTSAEAFVQRQQTFTRSVATSSIVGYVVGLGDRHINNILLHQQTAEVVHIDLGIAFDQNKLLPVPELVPFRMTRNIIDGLGVRGTEGSLRPCAEAALRLLREKRELLRTLLNSIMHDPLARWVIGRQTIADVFAAAGEAETEVGDNNNNSEAMQRRQQQQQQCQQQQLLLQASTRQVPPMRARASNADAARTLARIDAKLRGYEGGDLLNVSTHVRKLVEEAQRVEHLAVMFPGWSQWV